jgi:hypothetical protein
MDLDNALEFAVILSWPDLTKIAAPVSVRVEYHCESKSLLDHVIVWSGKGKGYSDRVCDYWTSSSSAHPSGARFWKGHESEQLKRSLEFILMNQDRFTSPNTVRDGLVLVYPPGDAERADAAAWGAASARGTPYKGAATN